MAAPTAETVADAMYALLKEYAGKRNLKPTDLTKAMVEKFGGECDKQTCKDALRILMESERTTYSYAGGSYVVLNPNHPA